MAAQSRRCKSLNFSYCQTPLWSLWIFKRWNELLYLLKCVLEIATCVVVLKWEHFYVLKFISSWIWTILFSYPIVSCYQKWLRKKIVALGWCGSNGVEGTGDNSLWPVHVEAALFTHRLVQTDSELFVMFSWHGVLVVLVVIVLSQRKTVIVCCSYCLIKVKI